MVLEKFYIDGVQYTSATMKARLYLKRNGAIDYGTVNLGKKAADIIGAFDEGDTFQYQRKITTNYTISFRGYIDKKKETLEKYELKVIANNKKYRELEHDASWASSSIETILADIDDDTGIPIVATHVNSDIVLAAYASRNIKKWEVVKQLAHYSGQIYWYDHKNDQMVVNYPADPEYKDIDLGTWTTESQIVSVPEWERNLDYIINTVTILYSGGSVTRVDANSVTTYGTRAVTYSRPEITNATDAQNLADAIKLVYRIYIQTAKFKVRKNAWTEDGSGYMCFPLNNAQVTVDDNINDKMMGFYIDEVTICYPEPYDEVKTAMNGVQAPSTDTYISATAARVDTIERNVDQAVTQTSSPTFDGLNIGADCNLYRLAANELKTDDNFTCNILRILYLMKAGSVVGDNDIRMAQAGDQQRLWLRYRCGGSTYTQGGICLSHYDNPCFFLSADGGKIVIRKNTSFDFSTGTDIFVIDANGNITTVGTVDGVDISAHVTDAEAHRKLPAPYEDASCDVSQVGAGSSNTEMNALSAGYVAIMPEKLSYAITITDSGAGYIDVQLDDDSWVNVFSTASTGNGSIYSYDVINTLGQRANYIKNIRSRAISASGNVTVNLDIWGWQQ